MIKTLAQTIDTLKNSSSRLGLLIKSGFPTIDQRYMGLLPQELWIIGAYTSSGKTFFALQLMVNIVRQQKRVLYCSLEMPSEALTARIWGNSARLDATKLELGNLSLEEHTRKEKAEKELLLFGDQFMFEDSLYSVQAIKNTFSDLTKLDKKPHVLIVDYLQNIQGAGDEYTRMSAAAVELQKFAKAQNITVLALSQTSNAGANESEAKVITYKGSGAIAAAADFGLWLNNKQTFGGQNNIVPLELLFRKVRRGPISRVNLEILFPQGKVVEMYGA